MSALQTLWQYTSEMTISRSPLVGQQMVRSQIIKTEKTMTTNPWSFTITVAPIPWPTFRAIGEDLNQITRLTPETITVGSTTTPWLFRYQGDLSSTPTGLQVASFANNVMVLENLPTMPSTSALLRSGDFLQISGFPYLYTAVTDVLRGSGTTVNVTVHRPNIITSSITGGTGVNVGNNCQISLIVTTLPDYKITPGAAQIASNGTVINNGFVTFDKPITLTEYTYQSGS